MNFDDIFYGSNTIYGLNPTYYSIADANGNIQYYVKYTIPQTLSREDYKRWRRVLKELHMYGRLINLMNDLNFKNNFFETCFCKYTEDQMMSLLRTIASRKKIRNYTIATF